MFARARIYLLPALVLALMVAVVGWRFWTPIDDARRALAWDAQWQYWGDLQFQIDSWKHGEVPLWNPHDRCGYPFAADPQTGVLYPGNWLLVAIGMVAGAKFWLVTAKTLFHLWWLAFGTFVWLQRRGTPRALCYAAGAFCLVAYPTNAWFSAINWGIAWLPWILLTIDAWSEAPSRRTAAWVALAVAMCALAGSPPAFWYASLVVLPYAGWALTHHGRMTERRAYIRAAATSGAIAFGLVVLMVAGQWLAVKGLVPYTVRSTRNLDFIASQGLLPDDLLGMAVPRMPGQNIYLGMVAVLAAGATLTLRPSVRSYVLAAIIVLGFALSLGPYDVFLSSFASFMPPARWFRLAQRYAYVVIVPFAALGAESVAALATLEAQTLRDRASRWLALVGTGGAAIAGIAIVTTPKGALHDAYILALIAWLAATWVLRQLVTADRHWRPRFVVIAALVFVLDVWFAHAPDIDSALWPRPTTPNDANVAQLVDVPLGARIFDRNYFKYRVGTRLHIRDLAGYEGDPLALERYAKLLDRVYQDAHVIGHANVAYIVEGNTADARKLSLAADFQALAPGMFRVPHIAPAVAWYSTARVFDDVDGAMAALVTTRPGSVAILERTSAQPIGAVIAAQSSRVESVVDGRIVQLDRNHLEADVEAPAAGVVVITEMYHPGWRATVDGESTALMPANGAFRAVYVGPGHHRIVMDFHIGGIGWLMLLSPLGLALALVSTRRKKQASAGPAGS